jgi:hypothetical protein
MTLDVTVGSYEYFLGRFGMWSYQGWSYIVQSGTIYYERMCFQYSDTIDPDSKWKSAQAFSIIASMKAQQNAVTQSAGVSPCL